MKKANRYAIISLTTGLMIFASLPQNVMARIGETPKESTTDQNQVAPPTDAKPQGQQPLVYKSIVEAVYKGDIEDVKQHLLNGANVNEASDSFYHNTLMHIAADSGNLEMVKLLLTNHADVNIRTDAGSTPLGSAVASHHPEMVKLLINNGADVNAKDRDDNTALHIAAWGTNINLEVVKLLINNKADVNATNHKGNTALHDAAKNNEDNNLGMVILLVDNKADANAKNNDGDTALNIAAKNENSKIVAFLRSRPAKE